MKYDLKLQKPDNLSILLFIIIFYQVSFKINWLILILSYFIVDYTLTLYHLFLDQPESKSNQAKLIKNLAEKFQEHHNNPANLILSNHLDDVKFLYRSIFIPIIILGYLKIINIKNDKVVLLYIYQSFFGFLGLANHYFCHAKTHKADLKSINYQYKTFEMLQNLKLLPNNKYHQLHHEKLNDNYNFTYGLHKLYIKIYNYSGKNYNLLKYLFYFTNHLSIIYIYLVIKTIQKLF